MKMTLTFDPGNDEDIESLVLILDRAGVTKRIRDRRRDAVAVMPIDVLCDGSTWPAIDYKIARILKDEGINTVGEFIRRDNQRDPQKIKGISPVQIERIRAAINYKHSI